MNTLEKILQFNQIDRDNIKIDLMKESPFVFFRGTAHLFFEVLSEFKELSFLSNKKLLCYIQGDSHINNLGFSNKKCSTVEDVKFDINDFDEAFIGNPFLDVIRYAVSIGFFFDELNNSNDEKFQDIEFIYKDFEMIEYFLDRYLYFSSKDGEITFNWNESNFMKKMRKKALKRIDTTNKKSRINKFTKLLDNKERVFDYENPKLSKLNSKDELLEALGEVEFDIVDICRRDSAGVGSAHLDRFYILAKKDDNYLLFELKEQLKPSYLNYFPEYDELFKNKKPSRAHIEAKQHMIKDYDIHLESITYKNRDFLLKSIFNAKYSIDGNKFYKNSIDDFNKNLKEYLNISALVLSNAHKLSSFENFSQIMADIKRKDFHKIVSITYRLYAINLAMFTHFKRDLKI